MGKTRGLGAGRKLRIHRRNQLWADKDYKKSHQGNQWAKPFAGCSHAKGIVLEKMCAAPPLGHRGGRSSRSCCGCARWGGGRLWRGAGDGLGLQGKLP
mmetsp:Transcript_38437/g.121515  ORF Transcript_38437/g.121515 Transcript_38437/m.121515 type:complete len:98 (+) Transcript_38437:14-307(+)